MRIVTVGTAILAIGILAALPFRHRSGQRVETAAQAASVSPQPSVAPLQEVPLEQFAQQQYWPVATQQTRIAASAEQAIAAQLPPLPASYTEVAVPLAMPQVIAKRYSATAPLRGGWSQDHLSSGTLAASAGAAADPWQRGLPLGQPLDRASTDALAQAGASADGQRDQPIKAPAADRGGLPWPTPDEVALAAQTHEGPIPQPAAGPPQRVTVARPAAHAITAVSSEAGNEKPPSAEGQRQKFYIREPQ